ncbi:hypothetical protein T492DRAFT_841774 [Pavlovales sp. CCMP2436]|nr:hypothetical protein T492DRAFT_841774 [Pavlovales sp. CCMP2436]
MAVITDVSFSKQGTWSAEAGLEFVKHVKATKPSVDVIIQSSEKLMREKAMDLGAGFVHKESPSLAIEIRDFFKKTLHFGPMQIIEPSGKITGPDGKTIGTASNITSLMRLYATLPDETIDSLARTNTLSKWFRARMEAILLLLVTKYNKNDSNYINLIMIW